MSQTSLLLSYFNDRFKPEKGYDQSKDKEFQQFSQEWDKRQAVIRAQAKAAYWDQQVAKQKAIDNNPLTPVKQFGQAVGEVGINIAQSPIRVTNDAIALAQLLQPNRASIAERQAQAERTLTPGGGLFGTGGILGGREMNDGAIYAGPDAGKNLLTTATTGADTALFAVGGVFPKSAQQLTEASKFLTASQRQALLRAADSYTGKLPAFKLPSESKHLQELSTAGKISNQVEAAPIKSLELGSDTLGKVDSKAVAKYTKEIKDGKQIDPIIVDSQGFVVDGKHRLAALKAAGYDSAPIVKETTTATATRQTADQLSQTLIDAANAEKGKYARTRLQKTVQKIKETLNVSHELRKIDNLATARFGTLNKTDTLEHAYDRVINANQAADKLKFEKLSDGRSAAEVMQAHAGDIEQFNNYRNAVAELYARSKGVKFRTFLSDQDLRSIVKSYEASNPTARKDIYALNEVVNKARKHAVANGAVTSQLDKKLGSSKLYTPVQTVKPDVPRPKIGGKSVTRAEQRFAKELSGPSDAPILNGFEPINNYIDLAFKDAAESRLSQLLLKRQKEGLIKDAIIRSEPGAKASKKILRDYSIQTKKVVDKVQRKVRITQKQANVLSREINVLNKRGVQAALKKPRYTPKTSTKTVTTKTTSKGTKVSEGRIGRNSPPDAVIRHLVDAEPGELNRIKQSIALREPRLAAKLDEVAAAQDEIFALKSEAKGYRQATAEIVDDSTTGKSIIRGMDETGNAYTMELPPELMRVLKGTDVTPQNGFMKAALEVQKTFQTFWSGFINPVFQFVSTPLYDMQVNVNALIDNPSAFVKSFKPSAIHDAVRGLRNSDEFQLALRDAGAAPQGASMMPQDAAKTIESIISKRNFASRSGYLIKNPKEFVHAIDQVGGKVSNFTRTRMASGYYKDAIKRGVPEADALQEAAFAYNNLAPNFNRINELARNGNAFIPYFTASLAGNRSMWQPILAHPGRAAAVYGGIVATFAGAVANNLSTEAGQEFYKQMRDSGKDYVLNNNYIIVLPTAHYNPSNGQWSGIIKIPVAPEMRYVNSVVHNSVNQLATGDSNLSPTQVASAAFNTMTGGVPESASQGPGAITTVRILANADPYSSIANSEPLASPYTLSKPKKDQVYPWTSNPAKFFSAITGHKVSPIQAEAIIRQWGSVGQAVTGTSLQEQVKNKFTGAYSDSLSNRVYKQSADYTNLSDKMKNSGGGVPKARTIAKDWNAKVDKLIKTVQTSSLSKAEKDKIISGLKRRKASTETSALQRRLD